MHYQGADSYESAACGQFKDKESAVNDQQKRGVAEAQYIGQGHDHTAERVVAQAGQLEYTDSHSKKYISHNHDEQPARPDFLK